jgi:hypothetical protein
MSMKGLDDYMFRDDDDYDDAGDYLLHPPAHAARTPAEEDKFPQVGEHIIEATNTTRDPDGEIGIEFTPLDARGYRDNVSYRMKGRAFKYTLHTLQRVKKALLDELINVATISDPNWEPYVETDNKRGTYEDAEGVTHFNDCEVYRTKINGHPVKVTIEVFEEHGS